ncbi:hypothetical protein Stsp02_53480 [Streptomyces sp. NBRC 14336]|nr:hypothetical protein Stsp02_53480 [Streptomyces sp. NBRC 14336]
MIVPVTAKRPRAARTPVPIWQARSPAVATWSTRQAIFKDRSTSVGSRRAIVMVVICAPAWSLDVSRYRNSSSCAELASSAGLASEAPALDCAAVLLEVNVVPLLVGRGWFARLNDSAGISNTCVSVGCGIPGWSGWRSMEDASTRLLQQECEDRALAETPTVRLVVRDHGLRVGVATRDKIG